MKKNITIFISILMTVVLVAGCGGGAAKTDIPSQDSSKTSGVSKDTVKEQEQHGNTCESTGCVWDPYTPYEETIVFTKGARKEVGNTNFPAGDSLVENDYTRYVKEQVNVRAEAAWEVDSNNYDQKVSLSIAANDIPDMMVVDRRVYRQLIDNELIWPMDEAFEKCLSPFLKGEYDTHTARLFEEITYDGKMMGLPRTEIFGQNYNVVWVREDWLKKVNMEPPTTMEALIEVARAFVEQDPGGNGTIGLTSSENICSSFKNTFYSMNSYPKEWIEVDGEVQYGSIQPETKEALAIFRDLYAEGILDKEFAVRQSVDRDELIASGKLGIVFSSWWPSGALGDAVINDPEAEWVPVDGPLNSDGKLIVPEFNPVGSILVVSKNFEHPEAIVKALNATYDMIRGNEGPGKAAYEATFINSPGMGWWQNTIGDFVIGPRESIKEVSEDIAKALEAGDKSIMTEKGFLGDYDLIVEERADPKTNAARYTHVLARTVGSATCSSDKIAERPVAFFGKTKTMDTKQANLDKLETETFIKIVMGEKPLDEFDNFVKIWKQMGGDEITEEVRAEAK